MAKNKFLVIGQTPPPYGGQIIHIGKIVSILERNKFEFKLLRMNFSEDMNETGKFSFLKIWKLFSLVLSLCYNLLLYRPDYVYYPPSGCEKVPVYRDFIMLFFVRLFRFKVIFHFHAGGLSDLYNDLSPLFKKIYNFSFTNANYSICMSASGVKDPEYLKSKEITIIPYGVDDVLLNAENVEKKSEIFQVLFVGVCRETKGIVDFVDVIRKANQVDSRIVGRIVGKIFGEKEEIVVNKAVLDGVVVFDGVKIGEEKNRVFCESNLFLFPTFFEHENFPTVNLEAFSAGLPVVSTRWRGVVNQVTNYYNGLLHEIHDTVGMSKSIVEVANNEVLCSQLSRNARKDYLDYYSEELFESNIIKFFNSLK